MLAELAVKIGARYDLQIVSRRGFCARSLADVLLCKEHVAASGEAPKEGGAVFKRFKCSRLIKRTSPFAFADEELVLGSICSDHIDVGLFAGLGVGAPPLPKFQCGER